MANPANLAELLEAMCAQDRLPARRLASDFDALPTFGGEDIPHTEGVWSWDATHMIIGTCAEDFAIVPRSLWIPTAPLLGDSYLSIDLKPESLVFFGYAELITGVRCYLDEMGYCPIESNATMLTYSDDDVVGTLEHVVGELVVELVQNVSNLKLTISGRNQS